MYRLERVETSFARKSATTAFACAPSLWHEQFLRHTGSVPTIYAMATISEALAISFQHHQAGQPQAAEEICRQILSVEPNHAHAWHLLGLIAYQAGEHDVAIEYIGRAVGLNGTVAAFHNNLGMR